MAGTGENPDSMKDIVPIEDEYFSPEVIADRLLWPIANRVRGRDWRENAGPGDKMTITERAVRAGNLIIVKMEVECAIELDEDGKVEEGDLPTNALTLEIGRREPDAVRELVLESIPQKDKESAAFDVHEDAMEAVHVQSYYFNDEDGSLTECGINQGIRLLGPNNELCWMYDPISRADDHGDQAYPADDTAMTEDDYFILSLEEPRFRAYDVDEIAFCAMLFGHITVEQVVDDIKQHPIEAH